MEGRWKTGETEKPGLVSGQKGWGGGGDAQMGARGLELRGAGGMGPRPQNAAGLSRWGLEGPR